MITGVLNELVYGTWGGDEGRLRRRADGKKEGGILAHPQPGKKDVGKQGKMRRGLPIL